MTRGLIFDYGGTIDTRGDHWGKVLWKGYERCEIPITEEQFREAYVHAERTLGRNPIIQPSYTFRKTLDMKLRIEMGLKATGTSARRSIRQSTTSCSTSFMARCARW